tara:strand:- start:43 stop:507 length:465 start_codon:yes stop_codon:yes gene_type:complete
MIQISRFKRFFLLSILGIGISLETACNHDSDQLEHICEDIIEETIEADRILSLEVLKPRISLQAITDYENKCYSLIDDGTIDKVYSYYENGYVHTSSMYNTEWECLDNKFVLYNGEDTYKMKIKKTVDDCISLGYVNGVIRVEVLLCDCEKFDY